MTARTAHQADVAAQSISVAMIVASIDDRSAGPSASVTGLANALHQQGAEVALHTLAGWRSKPVASTDERLAVIRHRLNHGPFGRFAAASSPMRAALNAAACEIDILHTHGLWLAPNIYPARALRQSGSQARLVLSPRGMLGAEPLAFSSWKKRAVWVMAQRDAAISAHCLHATAESEWAEIRAAGLSGPVAIIPNGIELPAPPLRDRSPGALHTLLSLGRLHPKKGLDRLLQAWRLVEPEHPLWRLRIVGPDENRTGHTLRALAQDLDLKRVTIEGPAYGPDKARAFSEADLFVLSSLNENFAMSVAEALASGLPVIATKGAPWSGLIEEQCGWWVDLDAASLAGALAAAMTMSDQQRRDMGARGQHWMARDFSWSRVGRDMLAVYNWLHGRAPRPDTVRLD